MAAGVAAHTDNTIGAHETPGIGDGAVLLSDMHTVASQFRRQLGTIVENECDIASRRDGKQAHGGLADHLVRARFYAQLKRRDRRRGEHILKATHEVVEIGDRRRAEEIKAARARQGRVLIYSAALVAEPNLG